jgi:hypothetical protein
MTSLIIIDLPAKIISKSKFAQLGVDYIPELGINIIGK